MEDITYTKVKQFAGKYHMIEENDLIAAGVSGGQIRSVCFIFSGECTGRWPSGFWQYMWITVSGQKHPRMRHM